VIPTEPEFPQLEDDQGKRYPLARPAEDSKAIEARWLDLISGKSVELEIASDPDLRAAA
jgi:hypothetical protein